MLSPRLWLAPVALFALQASPTLITADSSGRVRLTLGGDLGQYQEVLVSCSGETLDKFTASYRQLGGQADVWVSPEVRVTGFGGAMFSSTDRQTAGVFTPLYEGGYGGAMIAGEWRTAGLGGGMMLLPGDPETGGGTAVYPSIYVRLGNKEKVHFRSDFYGPPGAAAPPQIMRAGIGFGQGHIRKAGGFLGIGLTTFPWDNYHLGLTGDVLFPVSQSIAVGGVGALQTGVNGGNAGPGFTIGVMLRASLGNPPR